MSGTVKTVLIVGAAAVGAYLLVSALVPKAGVARQSSTPSGTNVVALAGLFSSVARLLPTSSGSAGSSGPGVIDTPGGLYVSASEARNVAGYDALGSSSQPVYGIAGLDY